MQGAVRGGVHLYETDSGTVTDLACRACRGREGQLVLDLGDQPESDSFPLATDPGPDPLHPLQMWLCASCGLAQLIGDWEREESPPGEEPAVVRAQAEEALKRLFGAGLLSPGQRIGESLGPHGSSWVDSFVRTGLVPAAEQESADVVLDSFGLMHMRDQARALEQLTARVLPGGLLLVQYHALEAVIGHAQWNILRHGHYAYYSTSTLVELLEVHGFRAHKAWRFDLYGGTVLLAASHAEDAPGPDGNLQSLLRLDEQIGVRDPEVLRHLQRQADGHAAKLREWLARESAAGRTVVGYGAASRATPLLVRAAVDRMMVRAVVDASAAKHGRRMPGTDIPIIGSAEIPLYEAQTMLLFVPDLLPEVRASIPSVERAGARWVICDDEAVLSPTA